MTAQGYIFAPRESVPAFFVIDTLAGLALAAGDDRPTRTTVAEALACYDSEDIPPELDGADPSHIAVMDRDGFRVYPPATAPTQAELDSDWIRHDGGIVIPIDSYSDLSGWPWRSGGYASGARREALDWLAAKPADPAAVMEKRLARIAELAAMALREADDPAAVESYLGDIAAEAEVR